MADADKLRKRARRAIAAAQGRHDRVVRLHRATSLRGADSVAGFVVSTGIRWVIVQRIGSDLTVDGYTAIRWKHLDSIEALEADDLLSRATHRSGVRPVDPAGLDPTTTGLLLRSIPDRPPLVTVWAERHVRATSWIGTIVAFENKNLHLRPIDRDGRLAPGTFSIAFRDITRIDLRTRYATALAAAAGLSALPRPELVSSTSIPTPVDGHPPLSEERLDLTAPATNSDESSPPAATPAPAGDESPAELRRAHAGVDDAA